ncbi:MAG: patatin-like phospholipase family protein [Acidimicrobiia bacterium]|nr:patatin-like phospholipase family protein [Acidimicrobiia bacterium]
MRFGLVLGAGGARAWVFHVGVLRTIRASGFEPPQASVIVGTSAGASIGAALRAGLGVDEILEEVTTPPTDDQRSAMLEQVRAARKTLKPLSAGLARHALPGGNGVGVAVAGLLPPGWFPTGWLASFPGMDRFDSWPDGLWIPAVRADDGAVVVFGRDRTDVAVHAAAEASSAVPGLFRPRTIDGEAFVDGGVASSTHADLLVDAGVDLAVVSAPLSAPSLRPFSYLARRALADEVAALEGAGIETIVVRPDAEAAKAARGYPRRNPGAASAILGHAERAARRALAA